MARPEQDARPCAREARRRDRRAAILTVAARAFLDHGYAGASMSAIAAALGGSKATLWNYFPSKEALFAAVLDHVTTAYRARLSQILDVPGDLRPTLLNLCTSFLEKVTSPDAIALHRLVVAEAGRFPEMGMIFYERGPRTTRLLVARFLEGAMERGLLRRDDPVTAARHLITLALSGGHQQILWGRIDAATPGRIAADARTTVDAFLRAYAPCGADPVSQTADEGA
ncbi:MAG: TetR/AcrR family transcriptional regulator [Sphingobium sp.]